MSEVKLRVEGRGAAVATENLFQLGIISGHWEEVDEVTTSVTLTGKTYNSVKVASHLQQWFAHWMGGYRGKAINKVIVIDKYGRSFQLSDMTWDSLAKVLDPLKSS